MHFEQKKYITNYRMNKLGKKVGTPQKWAEIGLKLVKIGKKLVLCSFRNKKNT